MRVLFVQKEGGIFGAENYQLKVIPRLIERGVNVDFLRFYTSYQGGEGGEFIERIQQFGVQTYEINIGRYPTFGVLKQIHGIAQGGYDLIHTHLIHADFYLALTKSLFRGKYVLVSTKHGYDNSFTSKHGFDSSKQGLTPYFLISKWSEKRMKASFTISHGLRNFFLATGLTTKDRMSLIHYGFDLPSHNELKGNPEYRLAPKQLMIAGRLIGFKGHRYLIDAMSYLVERYDDDIKLLIAGTGDLENELRGQVQKNGLSQNVVFLGYCKEVGAFMSNSDVVVVPSISEGFGVVFLEAFAAKTPVIAWNVPSGNELMVHGRTGYLVDPYDIEKLSSQIADVLDNPVHNEGLANRAHDRLIGYFNSRRMIDETIKFYKSSSNL